MFGENVKKSQHKQIKVYWTWYKQLVNDAKDSGFSYDSKLLGFFGCSLSGVNKERWFESFVESLKSTPLRDDDDDEHVIMAYLKQSSLSSLLTHYPILASHSLLSTRHISHILHILSSGAFNTYMYSLSFQDYMTHIQDLVQFLPSPHVTSHVIPPNSVSSSPSTSSSPISSSGEKQTDSNDASPIPPSVQGVVESGEGQLRESGCSVSSVSSDEISEQHQVLIYQILNDLILGQITQLSTKYCANATMKIHKIISLSQLSSTYLQVCSVTTIRLLHNALVSPNWAIYINKNIKDGKRMPLKNKAKSLITTLIPACSPAAFSEILTSVLNDPVEVETRVSQPTYQPTFTKDMKVLSLRCLLDRLVGYIKAHAEGTVSALENPLDLSESEAIELTLQVSY